MSALFSILEALLICAFCMALSSFSDAVFISSIVAKRYPFMGLFSFENRKKSQGAKFDENGG